MVRDVLADHLRDPTSSATSHPRHRDRGASRDRVVLGQLLTGTDAVVLTLAPTAKEASWHTETARGLAEVMPAAGVRRVVVVSGAGIDVPGTRGSPGPARNGRCESPGPGRGSAPAVALLVNGPG